MASLAFARSKSSTSWPHGLDWKEFEGQLVNNKLPLRRLLGSTDYSAVFLSQSPNAQAKNIALKLISCGGHSDSQTLLLQQASKLSHPNLLRLLPGGPCRLAGLNFVFVVMEYSEEVLEQVLRDRPLSPEETREMFALILEALSHIHGKGLAHSHIKPSNILSISNQIKLSSDAILPLGESRLAYRPLDVYDAPEAGTAPMATWSDVWSLGVTLVEVLTQRAPVSSPESQADPVVPYNIPQPYFEIARQCLHRDPLERWTLEQISNCLRLAPIQVAEVAAPETTEDVETTAPRQVPSAQVSASAGKTEVAAPEISGAAKKTAPAAVVAPLSPRQKRRIPHRKRGRTSTAR